MAKLQGKRVGDFMVNTEGVFLTIKKISQDFGVRLKCLSSNVENICKYLTDTEIEKQMETMFNAFQVFIITCIRDAGYFHAFICWNIDYWNKRGYDSYGKITAEENQKIIDEVRAEYEFKQEVKDGKHGETEQFKS